MSELLCDSVNVLYESEPEGKNLLKYEPDDSLDELFTLFTLLSEPGLVLGSVKKGLGSGNKSKVVRK
jgi:hypothetical protein